MTYHNKVVVAEGQLTYGRMMIFHGLCSTYLYVYLMIVVEAKNMYL